MGYSSRAWPLVSLRLCRWFFWWKDQVVLSLSFVSDPCRILPDCVRSYLLSSLSKTACFFNFFFKKKIPQLVRCFLLTFPDANLYYITMQTGLSTVQLQIFKALLLKKITRKSLLLWSSGGSAFAIYQCLQTALFVIMQAKWYLG